MHNTFRTFQTYLDLSDPINSPLHTYGPIFAFKGYEENLENKLTSTRVLPPAFRENLVTYLKLEHFKGLSPLDVPLDNRSERWKVLCERLENFYTISEYDQYITCKVLFSLGYYELVLSLLKNHMEIDRGGSILQGKMTYLATFSDYILKIKKIDKYNPKYTANLAQKSLLGSKVRFSACLRMLIYYSKDNVNINLVEYWREELYKSLLAMDIPQYSFNYYIMWSRFYRASSFLPFLRQDKQKTEYEIQLALELGECAVPGNVEEEIVWKTNLIPAYQTAAKVASIYNKKTKMFNLYKKRVDIDPLDSLGLIELGYAYKELEEIEKAGNIFEKAALLGPPGTPIAWFLAGCCYEQINNKNEALKCYINSLKVDPKGVSPKKRIEELGVKHSDLDILVKSIH